MFLRLSVQALILMGLSACASDIGEGLLSESELASLSLTNPQAVEGRVLTGGQPTPDDLAYLKGQGLGTVISLRGEGENIGYDEAAEAEKLGLVYVNVPVSTQQGLDATTAAYLRTVINQTQAPVLLHCGSGNRVGALYALGAHFIDGKPIEESLVIGRSAGLTGFEPTVRELLESGAGG